MTTPTPTPGDGKEQGPKPPKGFQLLTDGEKTKPLPGDTLVWEARELIWEPSCWRGMSIPQAMQEDPNLVYATRAEDLPRGGDEPCAQTENHQESGPVPVLTTRPLEKDSSASNAPVAVQSGDQGQDELNSIREYLWPNQTGLPNHYRDCLLAIQARERLAEDALTSLRARLAEERTRREAAESEAKENHAMWVHWQTEATKAAGENYENNRAANTYKNAFDVAIKQRDAALARVEGLRKELHDVRSVCTEALEELHVGQSAYKPDEDSSFWRWEATGEAVAGIEWDVTKPRTSEERAAQKGNQ